jgi:hypothetical protein
VRGVGDLEPQFSPGASGYARSRQSEEDYAWAGLVLGRSLLGQRVTAILGFVAALAAALAPRIARVYLARHLVSWRRLVEVEEYSHPFADFVPNILSATDLPHIARSILPRRVIVAGAVDAAGRALPRSEVPYDDYREDPAWSFDALSRL